MQIFCFSSDMFTIISLLFFPAHKTFLFVCIKCFWHICNSSENCVGFLFWNRWTIINYSYKSHSLKTLWLGLFTFIQKSQYFTVSGWIFFWQNCLLIELEDWSNEVNPKWNWNRINSLTNLQRKKYIICF